MFGKGVASVSLSARQPKKKGGEGEGDDLLVRPIDQIVYKK